MGLLESSVGPEIRMVGRAMMQSLRRCGWWARTNLSLNRPTTGVRDRVAWTTVAVHDGAAVAQPNHGGGMLS